MTTAADDRSGDWRSAIIAGLAYFLGAWLCLAISRSTDGVAALWIPNAFALCALLRAGSHRAGPPLLACTTASFVANLWGGNDLALSALFTIANMMTPVLAALVLRRPHFGSALFETRSGTGRFLSAIALATPVGATIAAGALAARGAGFADAWLSWASSDFLGTVLASAFVLTFWRLRDQTAGRTNPTTGWDHVWPLLVVLAVSIAVFWQTRFPLLFLPLVALLFSTFRLGWVGAAGGMMIVAVVSCAFLAFHSGPISLIAGPLSLRIQFLQVYLATVFATSLALAVVLAERDRFARERAASEHQHRQLVERSREVIFETDLTGRWTYLNPAWETVTGHGLQASVGTSFLSIIVAEDRAGVLDTLGPLFAGTADQCHQEVRYIRANGAVGWAAVRSYLLVGVNGEIAGTHGTLHDITNRRRLAESQRESENLYRLLAENSNDMIVRFGLDGLRKYVSPASRHLLGYDPEDMVGHDPAGDIHPEDRPATIENLQKLIAGGPGAMSVYRQRHKDGHYIWVEASYRVIRDADGVPQEAIASARDVSGRKAAELQSEKAAKQLQESHRLLLMAEDMAQIGHWRFDIASETVFWSDAVCEIHGVPAGHVPALATAIDVYHPDDREMIVRLVDRALKEGKDFSHNARIMRPDGSLRHVNSRGRAERAADGTIIGLFGVFQDVTAGYEANIALRQSEHRYKMLSDHATDIVLRLGPDGECLFISPSVAELTGFSANDLLHSKLSDRIHDDDAAMVQQTTRMLRATPGPSSIFEFRYQHRDGHWLWLEANLRANTDMAIDDKINLIGAVRLIDRRKLAEAKAEEARQNLRDSNRLLNMAEAVARLGHWRIDTRTQQLFWSDEVYSIYGIARDIVPTIERTFALYHPDDVAAVRQTVDQALATGTDYSCQSRIIRPDGTLVYILSRGEIDRDDDGNPIGFFGIVQDVTEQRQAEALLAEREARFRLITEQAGDIISLHDEEGRVLFISPSARAILGYEPEAMLGTTAWDYTIADDRDVLLNYRQQLMEQPPGAVCTCRFRMRRSDDRLVWVEVASRLVDYEGQQCSIRVCRDVSEQVRTEAQLREARGAAEAAAAAKSMFLATMSHEIRTPMTGVLGMVELLRADVDPTQRDRFFDTLERSAKTLMTVLDDILDFSKIESGNLTLETIDFDLADLARDVGDLFGNSASAKGLTLDVQLPSPHIYVKGDPTRIRQILSNLVSNAIKFTQNGGVSVALTAISTDAQSPRWRIAVADTGIGVDPRTSESLFSPFVQADTSTTRRFGGTGLGLSISKRLIDAMGGEIGTDANPGGGSIFWFEVALPHGQQAAVNPSGSIERDGNATASPLKVLVAEDNEINQMLLTALLRRLGHEATCVANGELAVAQASTHSYDVILMDMQMPVMDGVAATRAIRGLPGAVSDIPVIALTADALPERRRFYENIGLTDFLTKPVDVTRLAESLRRIVPARDQEAPILDETPVDASRLAELREVLEESTIQALLDLIASEAGMRPATIDRLVEDGDLAGAGKEAHALNGAASNIGASRLARAAMAIEQATDGTAALRALPELHAAAQDLIRWVQPASIPSTVVENG